MGAQILALVPFEIRQKIDGFLLVTCQSGYYKAWPWVIPKLWIISMWFVVEPVLRLFGASNLSVVAKGWDCPSPVYQEWARCGRTKGYIFKAFESTIERPDHVLPSTAPVLSISIADDLMAPRSAVDWIFKKFTQQHSTANTTVHEMTVKQFCTAAWSQQQEQGGSNGGNVIVEQVVSKNNNNNSGSTSSAAPAMRVHITDKIGHNGIFVKKAKEDGIWKQISLYFNAIATSNNKTRREGAKKKMPAVMQLSKL